jgi:hypothetical protein
MGTDWSTILIVAGVLSAAASALCGIRASLLATPARADGTVPPQATASGKTAQLIRLLRDYTWASRDVIETLQKIVHKNAPTPDAFEAYRLELSNAIRKYLDGSKRAEGELRDSDLLDFTPEISSAAEARDWLQVSTALALLSAGFQLLAIALT